MAQVAIAEIKASCPQPSELEKMLYENGASLKGEDHQIDTYFKIPTGRLKLREGNVENTLIFYDRIENKGIKNSQVKFLRLNSNQVQPLKQILQTLHPVLVVVEKIRKIFFIDNVKFHIDQVEGLGSFVEIEAIGDKDQKFETLVDQCNLFQSKFGIKKEDCIAASYSDLIVDLHS